MNHPHITLRNTCYIALLAVSLTAGGCGRADIESLFTDPQQLDEDAMKDPAFWDAAILSDVSKNLYELDNDLFLNKPYNNLFRFGNDILLVGEAYYGENPPDSSNTPVKYEYSFDVYSPWRNHILYSLPHQDIVCDSYQLVGDKLFLLNHRENTISIYNTALKLEGTYVLSELVVDENLKFYPASDPDTYYILAQDTGSLIKLTLSGDSLQTEVTDYGHYNYKLGDSPSNGEVLAFSGVNSTSLCYDYTIIPSNTEVQPYTIPADNVFLGDASSGSFIGLTNATEHYWVYSDLNGNDNYFRCHDVQQVQALPDGSFVLVQRAYDDTHTQYYVTYNRYSSTGQQLSDFVYNCGTVDANDFTYLSQNMAYFEDHNLCFILAYTLNLEPYILVWDTSQGASHSQELTMYATEEELSMRTDSIYYEQYAQQIDSEYGSLVTYINPWEDYDWGALAEANSKANALEEKYNISIYLGPEVPDLIDTFSIHPATNADKINKALDELERALSSYPDNFLSQLAVGNNRGIRIYLGGAITSTTEEALSEPSGFVNEINDYMVMVLDINYTWNWKQTIAHEFSHMIDRRLGFLNTISEDALFSEEKWASNNPDQFQYMESYIGYESNEAYELYSDYFIDAYCLTFPTEDRAVLFGSAMSDYFDEITYDDYFDLKCPTGQKFYYYCQCIRDGFDTTGWDNPTSWEQILSH